MATCHAMIRFVNAAALALGVLGLCSIAPGWAAAQEPGLEERIEELEQGREILESRIQQLEARIRTLFGDEAVQGCARALYLYALGLVPITISRICVGLCFAHENARSPARGAIVAFVVHALAALSLIGPLPAEGLPDGLASLQHRLVLADFGYAGLAAAASIAAAANAAYLLVVVQRRYGPLFTGEQARRLFRLSLATAAMGIAVEGSRRGLPVAGGASLQGIGVLMALVGIGAAVYGGALWLLGSPELRDIRAALRGPKVPEPPAL